MGQRGQGFIQILFAGLFAFLFIGVIFFAIFDPFGNVAFNILDASTVISQVGTIKLLIGLIPLIVIATFIVLWMRNLSNPTQGDFT
jgi:hypothetical protein